VLIFIDRAPVIWLSKKQTSVETSPFGPESTALKQVTESVVALRWEPRMSGVPLDGPSHIRCDNQSVVTNASAPASALKKRDNAIASHYVRGGAAAGVIDAHKESGETNLADALSKIQAWAVRQRLCDGLMHQKERSCRSPFGWNIACLTENASLQERSCLSYWTQPSDMIYCHCSCMQLLVGTDKIQRVMSCGVPCPGTNQHQSVI